MGPAHEVLKLSTAAAHQEIEEKMGEYFNSPSLKNYKEMILKYAGLYRVIENQFQTFTELLPQLDLPQRLTKFEMLTQDLADLNVTEEIPNDFHLPHFQSKAEFLGALYVLEGSTLGGQVLLKRFKESLGISESQGGHFLNAYGSEVGLMWRKFLAVLNQELQNPEDIQTATETARSMFLQIGNWMRPNSYSSSAALSV